MLLYIGPGGSVALPIMGGDQDSLGWTAVPPLFCFAQVQTEISNRARTTFSW